jgi:hypothetical protein
MNITVPNIVDIITDASVLFLFLRIDNKSELTLSKLERFLTVTFPSLSERLAKAETQVIDTKTDLSKLEDRFNKLSDK